MEMILNQQLQQFHRTLYAEEKSPATIRKYLHDVKKFFLYAQGQPLTKELVLAYKEHLLEQYAVSSTNTMLVSLNCFFSWSGVPELRVKTVRQQRETFRKDKELTKAEYLRLLDTAQKQKKLWLRLVIYGATLLGSANISHLVPSVNAFQLSSSQAVPTFYT